MSEDIGEAIRRSAKVGRLNHLSIAVTWDGKWEVAYRGQAHENHRIASHADVLVAIHEALTGRQPPKAKPVRAVKPKTPSYESLLDDL